MQEVTAFILVVFLSGVLLGELVGVLYRYAILAGNT